MSSDKYSSDKGVGMKLDVDDLVIYENSYLDGDSYIFEPSTQEKKLGSLMIVAETEDKEGLGKELIDTVVQALQKEYYRDPKRGVISSFESALHQANLVLHDLVEQGVREWMGNWHVAVAILADKNLHISTAGEASVMLLRGGVTTVISAGLSHSPITNPLRTFSQVASGVIEKRDLVFLGSSHFFDLFKDSDLERFTADQSAAVVSMRLKQLYEDQRGKDPIAVLVVAMVPADLGSIKPKEHSGRDSNRNAIGPTMLRPRKPLDINKSIFRKVLQFSGQIIVTSFSNIRKVIWPHFKKGSRASGAFLYKTSQKAGKGVRGLAQKKNGGSYDHGGDVILAKSEKPGLSKISFSRPTISIQAVQSWPKRIFVGIFSKFRALPRSSKIFAILAIVFGLGLIGSVFFLQNKKVADMEIQQASEWLHEARVKHEAAETALIYDNREQARTLLKEAGEIVDKISQGNLYVDDVKALRGRIEIVEDRLAKIARPGADEIVVVGDFETAIAQEPPKRLFFMNDSLYTYNPATNVIVSMNLEGGTQIVSSQTQGIGFFNDGSVQQVDKLLVLATDEPGVAVYDMKAELVQKQDFSLPGDSASIKALATFGNRLYVLDDVSKQIFSYSKTLRGYSNGAPWLVNSDDLGDVIDIAVDGFIYTLKENGEVNKWYKGEVVKDYELEVIDPPLQGDLSLIHDEEMRYLYVFDRLQSRVAMFDGDGLLVKQIFFSDESEITDVTVEPEEKYLFILEGSAVKKVPLRDDLE